MFAYLHKDVHFWRWAMKCVGIQRVIGADHLFELPENTLRPVVILPETGPTQVSSLDKLLEVCVQNGIQHSEVDPSGLKEVLDLQQANMYANFLPMMQKLSNQPKSTTTNNQIFLNVPVSSGKPRGFMDPGARGPH